LLEGLNEAVEQDPVEAPIPKANAILMVLVERVHGHLLRGEIPGAYRHERVYGRPHVGHLGDIKGEALG
jgi:hypothetical protein